MDEGKLLAIAFAATMRLLSNYLDFLSFLNCLGEYSMLAVLQCFSDVYGF